MTKPTIGVKASDETLERFNEIKKRLKDNGLTTVDEDALILLMDTFDETHLAKTLDFGPTFKELSQIVARITEIFSNQSKQFQTDKISREREQEGRLKELQEKFDKAVEESNLYKEDLKLKDEEVQELKKAAAQYDKEKEDLKNRIEEQAITSRSWETNYQKANKELEQVKAENLKMKGELDKVNEIKATLSKTERHKEELEQTLENQVEKHKNDMEDYKKEFERTLDAEEKDHQNEIGRIKNEQEKKHIDELKQARLERDLQESKLNVKLSELQEKYQKTFENLKSLETEYEKLKIQSHQELSQKKAKPKDEHPKPSTRTKKSEITSS
jgi:hypothetical protein